MRLSDVVANHGFARCNLAKIENARLYQHQHDDGVLELLCVQKTGAEMRVDRQPLIPLVIDGQLTMPIFLPLGNAVSNQHIPTDRLENYLNTTLLALNGNTLRCLSWDDKSLSERFPIQSPHGVSKQHD